MKEIAIQVEPNRLIKMLYREGTSDRSVIEQIWVEHAYGLFRFSRGKELGEIYEAISSSGKKPLIVDAGANIGASSLYFSEKYQRSRVIALEPEAKNFEVLSINTKESTNITCIRAALSSTVGEMAVVDPGKGEWGFRAVPEAELSQGKFVEHVSAVSVNQILGEMGEEYEPFIVKIDIEGGESDVFSKDTEWVDRFPILIIELHDWMYPSQSNSSSFIKCISKLNRDFVYIGENVFSIKNY